MIDLVTDVGPDAKYAGGQVLERLIRFTPSEKFAVHILDQGHLAPPTPGTPNWSIASQFFIGETNFEIGAKQVLSRFLPEAIAKVFGGFVTLILLLWVGMRVYWRISKSESKICWLVIQGQRIVITYIPLFLFSRKRLVVHQWDPIDWWLAHQRANPRTIAIFEKIVRWMCRRAATNFVPSDRWKASIEAEGGHALRVDNFFNDDEIVSKFSDRTLPLDEVHTVFVGQLYALPELNALIEAFARSAKVLGKTPVLHYYGAAVAPKEWSAVRVVEHGFISRERLLVDLDTYDFGLLPYPRSLEHEKTARFSFPSKSRVYVAAGLPILANCELGSSPHEFYAQSMGEWYANIAQSEDVSAFLSRSADPKNRIPIRRFCGDVARANFSSHVELSKFHSVMKGST